MSKSTLSLQLCVLTAMGAFTIAGVSAWGQSNSTLITDPGSTMTVTVGFSGETDYGPLDDADYDSTTAEGTARMTVLPTTPVFTQCRMQALSMALGDLQFQYFYGWLQVTFTDLVIESTEAFDGTIDAAGDITFTTSPLRVTGNVYVYSDQFGLDDTMSVDATSDAPIAARLTEDAGTLILNQIVIPRVIWEVPPEELPEGFTWLVVTVDTEASSVVLRGPYGPATPGDSDADDDLDLADFAAFARCFSGLDPVDGFCTMHKFDADTDVDLDDYQDFRAAFTGPQP